MAVYNLGRFAPIFRGNYNGTATYQPLDIVYYNGSSYVAKQTTSGRTPSNNMYWQIVALAGEFSGTLTPEQQNAIVAQIITSNDWVNDAAYTHTDNNFTDADKAAIESIGNGNITIQRNNTTIGEFSTNGASNHTINVNVPTAINQLSGWDNLTAKPIYKEHAEKDIEIDIKPNEINRYIEPLTMLKINGAIGWNDAKSIIEFTAANDITVDAPDVDGWINKPDSFDDGVTYRFIFEGNAIEVRIINKY